MKPYFVIDRWDLSADLKQKISTQPWQELKSTSGVDAWSALKIVVKGAIKKDWSLSDFFRTYGFALNQVVDLRNLQLLAEHENEVLTEIQKTWPQIPRPIIRLQVLHSGIWLPIHIDATRTASFVIPISSHEHSITQFYRSSGLMQQLVDPSRSTLFDQIEILRPTLIDTKVPHAVKCQKPLVKINPRMSLTIKWEQYMYKDLVQQLG